MFRLRAGICSLVNPARVVILISGTLQIRYNLGGLKEPFVISLDHRNVANGQPHSVNISRRDRLVHLQVESQINANTDDRWGFIPSVPSLLIVFVLV